MTADTVAKWHEIIATRDLALLDAILADDAVFISPVVHTPQVGKELTKMYLTAAYGVVFNETFRYVREIVGPRDAMLEFVVELEGLTLNGVDIFKWNAAGKIVEFKVLVRPLKAINYVHQKMVEMLQAMQS